MNHPRPIVSAAIYPAIGMDSYRVEVAADVAYQNAMKKNDKKTAQRVMIDLLSDYAEQIMATGLWHSEGKTPDATVSARLYSDIKSNGGKSAFVKVAPQTFALRDSAVKPSPASAGLSFTDCAQKVLEEFGGKKPMHYKAITEKALQESWLLTSGKTPEATMYAQVITQIKRQQKRGERPRFVQHGRGYVGLSQWMGRGLAFQIEQHNHQIRKALRERLLAMKPGEFEELISQLLAEMGFEMVEVTKLSGDGGIDVRGTLVVGDVVRIKMAVQVKKWKLKNNIQAPVARGRGAEMNTFQPHVTITNRMTQAITLLKDSADKHIRC